jgi:ADP-heptose:LPS heptosyltransferase
VAVTQERPTTLVLRALGLGDLLTAVPALRAVRRHDVGHRLVLATPNALRGVVDLIGGIDEVLPATGLSRLDWVGEPPTLAVNLHGRGPQSHLLLQEVTPRRLLAFDSAVAGVTGPTWDPDEHEVRRWCRLVDEGLGTKADPGDLQLRPPKVRSTVAEAIVVHPGAAHGSRRWPVDRFATVARHLVGRGHQLVVTGSANEHDLAQTLAAKAGLPPETVLAGRTDLGELAAVVAAARLVICGDTGIAHLASAYRRPSVVLFGPVSPSRWGPPNAKQHRVLWHGDGSGDPFAPDPDRALLAISVEEVLASTVALLDDPAREPAVAAARGLSAGPSQCDNDVP